jgi:hypothetical protein
MSNFIGPLDWSKKQGYILTGGGILTKQMVPGRDFEEEDLPHHHLKNNNSHDVFQRWIKEDRRCNRIVGLWSRPLFAGGWAESTDVDTCAFNMQTPSVFIDLRFPVARPAYFRNKSSFSDFTIDELKLLARQHCFSGYSLPEPSNVFTRHHIIDWNYHPSYPRPRPNRWRVELKEDAMSFKEHSVALDDFGVPVYFERWARISGDSKGHKYFAARRTRAMTPSSYDDYRDGVLILMGSHFTLAVDRRSPFPSFEGCPECSGGPALVDYAASIGDRESIEAYLDLQGSYGHINTGNTPLSGGGPNTEILEWKIEKSTHPWLEGQSPLTLEGEARFIFSRSHGMRRPLTMSWAGYEWEVLECSYTPRELSAIFNISTGEEHGRSVLRPVSRL